MKPPASLRTLRILWFALLSSNAIYLGVLFFLRANRTGTPPPGPDPVMAAGLAFVAVSGAVASLLLPPRLYAQALAGAEVPTRADVKDDPMGAQQGFRRPAATEQVFADPTAALHTAVAKFMSPFIVGMALAENASVLGFVLGYLGAAPLVFLPFFALGAGLQAARFPSLPAIVRAFEAARGARLSPNA